jgi:integrase
MIQSSRSLTGTRSIPVPCPLHESIRALPCAPSSRCLSLDQFGAEWWSLYACSNLTAKTQEGYRYLWGAYVSPTLGALGLDSLTPLLLERWKAHLLAQGVGPESVKRTMIMLQGALQRAVEWEYLASNPIRRVRKPRSPQRRMVRPLTPTVVEEMRRHLVGRNDVTSATLLSVMAYAGLRPGEALALTWGSIAERTILVEQAASMGQLKGTKTRRVRTVRLLVPLANDLASYRRASLEPQPADLLFAGPRNNPWSDSAWRNWRRRVFRPAAASAGASGARPYDLRHSFVSLLIAEGHSIIDIARQAGHSATITLDTYGHVFDEIDPGDRRSAEDRILAAREPLLTQVTETEVSHYK